MNTILKWDWIKTIHREDGTVIGTVDEHTSLGNIQTACHTFFRPFGKVKRETYSIHRGQLIVRHTVQFTGRKPERCTIVYLFFISGEMANDTFCVSAGSECNNINQAKKLIDKILDGGEYHYGI